MNKVTNSPNNTNLNNPPLVFQHPQFGTPRIVLDEQSGEPWFVAKDIAEVLELVWNGTTTIKHVPEEWRGVLPIMTPSGPQEMLCLTEQGLYFFLARSDKPKALPFQKWLAGEVLPAIHKSGGYIKVNPEDTPELIMARAILVADSTIKRLKSELEVAKPKAVLVDRTFVLRAGKLMRLTDLSRKFPNLNTHCIKRDLVRLGYLYRKCPSAPYRVYYNYRDRYFVEKFSAQNSAITNDIFVTRDGAVLIARLYAEDKLTRKVG
jgi:prophage antirepressor-like protein